jgi:hypothetical protein
MATHSTSSNVGRAEIVSYIIDPTSAPSVTSLVLGGSGRYFVKDLKFGNTLACERYGPCGSEGVHNIIKAYQKWILGRGFTISELKNEVRKRKDVAISFRILKKRRVL